MSQILSFFLRLNDNTNFKRNEKYKEVELLIIVNSYWTRNHLYTCLFEQFLLSLIYGSNTKNESGETIIREEYKNEKIHTT